VLQKSLAALALLSTHQLSDKTALFAEDRLSRSSMTML